MSSVRPLLSCAAAHPALLAAVLAALCAAPLPARAAVAEPLRDAGLEAVIRASVTQSPLVAARRSEVSASRHDVSAARRQYAPNLSTQLQTGSGPSTQYASALRADQRLYTAGRIGADVDAATARHDSAVLSVQETALSVAVDIVGAWQQLQAAEGQQQALVDYRRKLDGYGATIARRIDSGVSPATEQALVGARIAQAENDIASAQSAARSARATLQRLAGAATSAAPSTALPASIPAVEAVCVGDAMREAAIDRHPGVRRIEQDIEAARFSLQSQRAATRPTVTVRVEQPVGPQPAGLSHSTRVSLLLEYTTESAFAGSARADSSAERVMALQNQALALRREVDQRIQSECADRAAVARRLQNFTAARGLTLEVLASYERLFAAGKRTWVDVLNAAREDFDNAQGLLAAGAALRASTYRLALLAGEYELGLPQPADVPAPTTLFGQIVRPLPEFGQEDVS